MSINIRQHKTHRKIHSQEEEGGEEEGEEKRKK
jgi:hypothetical protein